MHTKEFCTCQLTNNNNNNTVYSKYFFLKQFFIFLKNIFSFSAEGVLPDGLYKLDTRIYFCCKTDEVNPTGIILPRDKPFYLFPHASAECQPVIGMKAFLEVLQYDLENYLGDKTASMAFHHPIPYAFITADGHLTLYYCYYEPGILVS